MFLAPGAHTCSLKLKSCLQFAQTTSCPEQLSVCFYSAVSKLTVICGSNRCSHDASSVVKTQHRWTYLCPCLRVQKVEK